MKTALILLSVILLLVGCGNSEGGKVSGMIINESEQKCKNNDGIHHISNGEIFAELRSCGMRCVTDTGRIIHRAALQCNNGARFKLELFVGEAR